jgi:succinate dehydrogenase / fumarate reductase iron-sulfur subunit
MPHFKPTLASHTVTVTLRIQRYSPRATPTHAWTQDYALTVSDHTSLLECLLLIKRTQDPSLAFRYSCGHGMCGSDAVAVNGIPRLLCLTKISDLVNDSQAQSDQNREDGTVITVAALPAFPPVRDLIVDLDPMLDQIRRLSPYLHDSGALRTTASGKVNVFEYLQHPDELEAFDQLTNCIACGVCEGACPIYVNGTPFIGPAAAVAVARFVFDSRENEASRRERLASIDTSSGIWPCKGLRFCTQRCPRGIDVSGAIWKIMSAIKENKGE